MSGSGWEAFPDVREWSGGPPGYPTVVVMLSRIFESSRVALPNVRELLRVPPGRSGGQIKGLGMVGTTSLMSLKGRMPFRMSGSCRVALPDVREALPVVWVCSEGPPGCPEGLLGCPGVVRSPPGCP